MKQGRIFYSGSAIGAADYFDKVGKPCPLGHNIADHVMMLSQSISHEECLKQSLYVTQAKGIAADSMVSSSIKTQQQELRLKPKANFPTQLKALFIRECQHVIRDKGALIARFGITTFLSTLYGAIFYDAGAGDNGDRIDMQNHFGAITMVTISSMFGSAQPVMLQFPFERPLFMREYSTGTYAASAYSLVKTLVDVPLTLATTALSWGIAFGLINLQGNFFIITLAAWGLGVGAASIGMMVGCAVADVKTVSEFAPVLFVPQMLFAGFFIATDDIPAWLRWAQWTCGIKYAMNLILLSEFDPDLESCENSPEAVKACSDVLSSNDITEDKAWLYAFLLFAIFVFFRVVAVTLLVAKSKRFY
jgi:ABC-type multidrug transport system permease subunit